MQRAPYTPYTCNCLIAAAALLASAAAGNAAPVIAYQVAANTAGNQDPGGEALGMDFDVNSPIVVTQLGVFDSNSNGLAHSLTAQLYNRDTQLPVTPLTTFAAGTGAASGTLIGGSRFLDITAVSLPAGFHGTIAVSHQDAAEMNFNTSGAATNITTTLNTGGGAITFVGGSRHSSGVADVFPNQVDGGPEDRYDAGTFAFTVPEPASTMLLAASGIGLLVRRRAFRA